jgi:rfaE bifunctional protein kinase chain/domain
MQEVPQERTQKKGFIMRKNTVLVIGDLIVDLYRFGEVTRMSPEAPIPVLLHTKEERKLGGAANVALNLTSLGCNVIVAGTVGDDVYGEWVEKEMKNFGISTVLFRDENPTIVKRRFVAGGHQILREDVEKVEESSKLEKVKLAGIRRILTAHPPLSAVVISDYAKGMLNGNLIREIKETCWTLNIPIFVDPKPIHMSAYWGVNFIKLNVVDLISIFPMWKGEVEPYLRKLQSEYIDTANAYDTTSAYPGIWAYTQIICTQAERGCMYLGNNGVYRVPANVVDVVDVTGAGDVFLAVFVAQMLNYTSVDRALRLANEAATESCKFRGTWVIPKDSKYSIKKG